MTDGKERRTGDPFQAAAPWSLCFGCGPANELGLRIESWWDGDEAVCRFSPRPHHAAGPPDVVNGGIIATVIDCHSIWTAAAHASRTDGSDTMQLVDKWYVTASLHVEYLRPTPLQPDLELRARVSNVDGRRSTVECRLLAADKECARGSVVAVQVPGSWVETVPS